ncbi:MAG: dihydrolipoyl dehydrogenase [Chloroflexota bacterium]|nr:dihydrolipoyl dehydrogenase [Chloroflexota bacterium]
MPTYDVVIIGAGPGGYVAALRAAQLGMKAAVVERDNVGGTCLNWGCIPSKALIRNAEVVSLFKNAKQWGVTLDGMQVDFGAAVDRSRGVVDRMTRGVNFLFRKNGVDVVSGQARLLDVHTVTVEGADEPLEAEAVIVATGARPRSLPGLDVDGELVMTSREALEARGMPSSAVFVGGGAIGCELAYVYNAYGVDTTIVEALPRLLPLEDAEVSAEVERVFGRQGIRCRPGTHLVGYRREGDKAVLTVFTVEGKDEEEVLTDRVVVAVGVQGNTEGLGLEEAGVVTERGLITVDEHLQTTAEGIYAVGDVNGLMPLAHVASAQGVYVVERLAGRNPAPLEYRQMPTAVYIQPQVASFGMTEQDARDAGLSLRVGKFPFRPNGKALGAADYEGFVKLVVEEGSERILGAHMVGPEVTELLGELSMNRQLEGTARELGMMVHAHPSLSEVVKEAALAAVGEALHG